MSSLLKRLLLGFSHQNEAKVGQEEHSDENGSKSNLRYPDVAGKSLTVEIVRASHVTRMKATNHR